MVRLARCEVIDPGEVAVAHVMNRTCRRCFLFGDDPLSGKNFDHRKVWIEQYLQEFAASFGIDLLGFSILSNHFHLVLRTRPDVVATWSDEEVARRWLMLCPKRRKADGSPVEPSTPDIQSIAGCPIKRQQIRERLSSISWWMRLLCQRVAMRANREDEEHGRFFQDRYRLTRLADEAALLACAAYVDLNPIRAGMAETLESSDHTSVQKRIEALKREGERKQKSAEDSSREPAATCSAEKSESADSGTSSKTDRPTSKRPAAERLSPADFLSPLPLDERSGEVGPNASDSPARCSDKGFLPMTEVEYLELLDWTARQTAKGKRGRTPEHVPPLLKRLGLETSSWCELVNDFGKLFCTVAGRCSRVDTMRSHRTHRRFYLRRRARELMTAG